MSNFKWIATLTVAILMITPLHVAAGGPALSQAFFLCNTLSAEADYSPESVKTLSKDLGFPFYIYAFHVETAGKGHRAYVTSVDRDMSVKGLREEITSKCKEYTPSVDALLQNEINDWVKANENIYTQGSIFIVTPYSKQSEQLIRESKIYNETYDKLVLKVKDNWIVAYTTYSHSFAKYLVLGLFSVFVIVSVLATLKYKRKNKKGY